jgi:retron-type reverse transcriptase
MRRTPSRESVSQGLDRVRQAAKVRKKERFTALLHHVSVDLLKEAYFWLKRNAAPGVDGVRWQDFAQDLEANIGELHARIHRGAYRALPSRRKYIAKPDGRQRPLGIAALEDKIVQRALVEVLNAIYEEDFSGFSYGFRPGRSQHDALDALATAITRTQVNWILDADIRSFFDSVSHDWLARFVEHRIGDPRVIRLIRKWLEAGVMEEGVLTPSEAGTPQGAVASPLLANIYLHYVFDLWAQRWRQHHARGNVIFGKPETFDFLGFTHICGRSRKGLFQLKRKSRRDRMRAKLGAIKAELRRRMHDPIPQQGQWLRQVVRGYFAYHAVPTNIASLSAFRHHVGDLWRRALKRRSQKDRTTWSRIAALAADFLPVPRILHPWPDARFAVTHRRWEPGA